MNHFPRYWVKIPKFDNYHPPPIYVSKMLSFGKNDNEWLIFLEQYSIKEQQEDGWHIDTGLYFGYILVYLGYSDGVIFYA